MALSAYGMAGGPTGFPNNMAGGVNPRDRITQALMQIQNPPPPMGGAPAAGTTQLGNTAMGASGEPAAPATPTPPPVPAMPIPAPSPTGAAPSVGMPPPMPMGGVGAMGGIGAPPQLPQPPGQQPFMQPPQSPYGM